MSNTARHMLKVCVKLAPCVASALVTAEGTSNATVARNNCAACSRALAGLNSWLWCFNPPSRNDAPNMNSVLVTIAPAMDAFTSMYWPARNAASAMISSVRLPSVALSKPPTASPVLAATDSVA